MKHLYYLFLLLFAFSSIGIAQTPNASGVLFVNKNVTGGTQSGDSWANALSEAADAFKAAAQLNATQPGTVSQIWVAAGTYKPKYRPDNLNSTNVNDRANTFLMVMDVKVYGGFTGTETTLSERNLNNGKESILSGDIGIQGNNTDNAYNVVISINNVGTAELNGFSVIEGRSSSSYSVIPVNGYEVEHLNGAGMFINVSSPTITNVKFKGSVSNNLGGALCIYSSASRITNVLISGNQAGLGGAMAISQYCDLNFTNATISSNAAPVGGSIYIFNTATVTPIVNIRNSVISGNQSIYTSTGGAPNFYHSLVEGVPANTTNLDGSLNPQFGSAPSYTATPFTNGLYTLQSSSPLIDKGSSIYYSTGQNPNLSNITTDIVGNARNQLTSVDIGAYEYPTTYPAIVIDETHTDLLCHNDSNGTINTTVSGGIPPYKISWNTVPVQTSQNLVNLKAGTYTITVEDAVNQVFTKTITIDQPNPVSGTIYATNVACFGSSTGSINITPTGGTAPYTYLWNNGATTKDISNLSAGPYSVVITDKNGCKGTLSYTVTAPASQLSVTSIVTNIKCFNGNEGNINLTVTGGTPPYTYDWGNGITTKNRANLTAGTYTVTVKDSNGCSRTVSINVEQPNAITVTKNTFNVTCNGGNNGSATVNATGGTGTLSYAWSTSPVQTTATATGLKSGTYTVTITDERGCTKVESVDISQPIEFSTTFTKVNVSCYGGNDGSATVTATGGTGTLSYAWNTSPVQTTATATGLSAGTYKVTIKDANGCTTEESVTIMQPTEITASINKVDVACNGGNTGSATITASGGTGTLSYSWNTIPEQTTATATGLGAGIYKVTVKDGFNCTKEVSVTINQPTAITASINKVDVSCNGGTNGSATVIATGGTGTLSYSWNTTPVQTSATATGLKAGTYTVTITDENNCSKVLSTTIEEAEKITANITKVDVTCYKGSNGSATVTATGGTGTLSYAWNTSPVQTTATATGLKAGTYTVTITDKNNCTEELSITVEEAEEITTSFNRIDVSCNGGNDGSAMVTATGGTGTLSYAWNTSPVQTTATATNLRAGTYTVTITDDNNCSKEVTIEILEPDPLNIVPTQINLLCSGSSTGSASVAVTGGTAPYDYVWNNGITSTTNVAENLTTGTYTVTVTDAKGCIITETFIFKETSSIAIAPTQENVKCNGTATGSATVVATGGIAPYKYIWNNGVTSITNEAKNLAAGTYGVTVIDANNCELTHTFIITEPTALVIEPYQVDVLCNGNATGLATVQVSGGTAPYSYIWNNDVTLNSNGLYNLSAGTYEVTVIDANDCELKHTFTITEADPLTIQPTQENISCNGNATGSATIVVSGGVAPYIYSWNNGVTSISNQAENLTAGTYEVTVKDGNNCTITHTFTITQPEVLNLKPNQVNVLCNGNLTGSAVVEVTGGTAPYTYVWNNGITSTTNEASNLAAGTYEVIVSDANNCTATQTFVITEPEALTVNPNQENVTCNGNSTGTATVVVTGGVAPYTYGWNNGITSITNEATNLAAGTYEVTVTDGNGCTITETFVITELTQLTIDPTQVNVLCNGASTGSATVVVSGGEAPYEYVWNNGITSITSEATDLLAGTYEVTVTDFNGCSVTHTFNITEPLVLVSNPTQQDILCHGETSGSATVEITGGVAPYQYVWNNGITSITNQATNLAAGTYEVIVTDANGCTIVEQFVITEPEALIGLPTQENVACNSGSTGSATIDVTGGKAPYTYVWNNGLSSITNQATNLTAGTYEVSVTDANGCSLVQTFVITEPTAIIATTSKIDVACNSGKTGEASVIATGGEGTLTFEWNTNPVQTTATAVGLIAGTYTVTITDENGCFVTETVTINEPAAIDPPVASDQYYCGAANTKIQDLVVTGTDVQWYDVAVGGTPLNPTTIVTTGTYYASQTINGCESNTRKAVQVIITITPEPTANSQTFCMTANATVSDLVAVGTNLKWYSTRTSTIQLNPTDLLTTGTYFVTQTLNGCESLVRTVVEVTILNTPTPIAVDQVFCFTSNATVANIVASGSNIKWYNVATGGTPLSLTTPLTSGTYYASQTIDGCESIVRKMVTITITQPVPLTTTQLNVCHNTRVQNMIIEGLNYTQLKWYDSATSTTEILPSMLLTSTTYYVSTFVDACESVRQPIQITVAATVPAPTAVFQSVCTGTVLNDLVVGKNPAATLNWYTSAQSMIPIAGTTIVTTGTYYVQQVLDGCESARIPVQVQVIYITEPTIFTLTICEGTTIGSLNTGNTNYVWYIDNTTQTPLPDTYVITSGNYYIANKIQNCISGRKMIATNVSARPASPTGQSKQLFEYKATVANIKMNESNIVWFATYEDAVAQVNPLSNTEYLKDGSTYYGILIGQNNCGSLVPTAVEVTINLSNQELDLAKLKYYPNPTDSYLTISYIEDITKVELYAVTGQRVLSVTNESKEIMVDLRNLSSGTYLVKIQTATASQFVKVVRK